MNAMLKILQRLIGHRLNCSGNKIIEDIVRKFEFKLRGNGSGASRFESEDELNSSENISAYTKSFES